jgi:hypothetical protein
MYVNDRILYVKAGIQGAKGRLNIAIEQGI